MAGARAARRGSRLRAGSEIRRAIRGSCRDRGRAARRSTDAGPRASTRGSRIRRAARSPPTAPRAARGPRGPRQQTRPGLARSRFAGLWLKRRTRDEVDAPMRRVAERLVCGVAAAAELDGMTLGNRMLMPVDVEDRYRTGDDVRPVRLRADRRPCHLPTG